MISNKKILMAIPAICIVLFQLQCTNNTNNMTREHKAIFLHHSTGFNIWKGDVSKYVYKIFKNSEVKKWIKNYNKSNKTDFLVDEKFFPEMKYGWKNYPYDYYNIWVKNAGDKPYMDEPTLEMLTKEYGLIIWKHCYPVTDIEEDSGNPDVNSEKRTLENYKLQYTALKKKMLEFPNTKFLVWTGAVRVKDATNPENAERLKQFTQWVKNEWDQKGDNIYLWDFYEIETEGGLYLKREFAADSLNSHPNKQFSHSVAPLFGQRIVDVLSGKGDETPISGKSN